jgi:hypothetical protein
MLTPVEMNLLYCQWFVDVHAMLEKQPQFLVGEVCGVDWKPAYQTVYDKWCDPTATNWRNYNVARTQLGRILKTFLPRLNKEMGVEIKTRGIDRKGHGVCQYYIEVPTAEDLLVDETAEFTAEENRATIPGPVITSTVEEVE